MDYQYDYHKISFKSFFTMMLKWLLIGLGLTALTSVVFSLFVESLFAIYFPIMIISCIVEIIMVIILVKNIRKLSINKAKNYFYIYSIINGITMSFIIYLIAPGAVVLAFLLTCAYFGLLYTIVKNTDYDFSTIGRMSFVALPILVLGYIVLLFMNAPILYYLIITFDLIVFTGLTLYDMRKVKILYEESSSEQMDSIALICAFELYLDFINIFIDILNLIADNS